MIQVVQTVWYSWYIYACYSWYRLFGAAGGDGEMMVGRLKMVATTFRSFLLHTSFDLIFEIFYLSTT